MTAPRGRGLVGSPRPASCPSDAVTIGTFRPLVQAPRRDASARSTLGAPHRRRLPARRQRGVNRELTAMPLASSPVTFDRRERRGGSSLPDRNEKQSAKDRRWDGPRSWPSGPVPGSTWSPARLRPRAGVAFRLYSAARAWRASVRGGRSRRHLDGARGARALAGPATSRRRAGGATASSGWGPGPRADRTGHHRRRRCRAERRAAGEAGGQPGARRAGQSRPADRVLVGRRRGGAGARTAGHPTGGVSGACDREPDTGAVAFA